MEFTREIYWNVGHGTLTLVLMYLLVIAAGTVFCWTFMNRLRAYRQGQSLKRTDDIKLRVGEMFKNALLQKKVLQGNWPGLLHAVFFWCFLLLLVGTTLIFIQVDFTDPLFGFTFLTGTFYTVFSITLDLAGILAIIMLGLLFIRRYIFKPEGLETQRDDGVMHGLLFSVLVSGFVIEGARIAVTELGTPVAAWSPIGMIVANMIAPLGEEGLRSLHAVMWWFHLLMVMVGISLIPSTKFRHILTTSTNYLFADHGPKGKLASVDLEDEDAEKFGASSIQDLSWKDIFDADACTLCKRCQDRCPAWATGKPLSPMNVIKQIGDIAFSAPEAELIETIGKDAIWACTTCRACEEICPASIEHVGKIVAMRRSLVLMEGAFPGEEVMAAMEQAEVNGNPLGKGFASRGDWANELGVKPIAEDPHVDILYFVGCYGSFDMRNIRVAESFIQLCQAAGVKVGILGKEEKCCGEPMRKLGNEYLYQTLAMENIQRITNPGINKIVTTCPHCFNTLEKDYRDLGLEAEVVPHTVFLEQLIASGRLRINNENFSCTYHDSCYLGRYNDMYETPRKLIKVAGGQLVEMQNNRDQAFCCGAGGGRIMAEEKTGERINLKRVRMAMATQAPFLLSNCPFCLTMFEDGVKGAGAEGALEPKDIAEVLVERLEST